MKVFNDFFMNKYNDLLKKIGGKESKEKIIGNIGWEEDGVFVCSKNKRLGVNIKKIYRIQGGIAYKTVLYIDPNSEEILMQIFFGITEKPFFRFRDNNSFNFITEKLPVLPICIALNGCQYEILYKTAY